MKILTINTSDTGGAGIAAYRLHQGLLTQGVDAKILVLDKNNDDPSVIQPSNVLVKHMNRLRLFKQADIMFSKRNLKNAALPFSVNLTGVPGLLKEVNNFDPDIVHMHWVNGGYLRPSIIKKFNKPIVWSLHDMWPFTGGCHYSGSCTHFTQACTKCPLLKKENDYMAGKFFEKKQGAYNEVQSLTIVGLSRWIYEQAKKSSIFDKSNAVNFVHLPNGIDTQVYRPVDKTWAKAMLNVPAKTKVVLFGAFQATSDSRKGYDLLIQSLQSLDNQGLDIRIVVFGADRHKQSFDLPYPFSFVGTLQDDISKSLIYNAADLTLLPSREENLSNVVMESMACGTPVVAFDIGGNGDMVQHKKTGYLAEKDNASDFAKGIQYLLKHDNYNSLRETTRNYVEQNFELGIISNMYLKLYYQILSNC